MHELLKLLGDGLEGELYEFKVGDVDSLVNDREDSKNKQGLVGMPEDEEVRLAEFTDGRVSFSEGGEVYGMKDGISFH